MAMSLSDQIDWAQTHRRVMDEAVRIFDEAHRTDPTTPLITGHAANVIEDARVTHNLTASAPQ
jgi:hypothetical protein